MTTKKSYSRYFIILQEQEKGYSLATDKLTSGYAKIEIKNDKCKISYYVQNLKKDLTPYHMILICNKKDVRKIINLGELNIDDNGRTDVTMELDSEDLDGSRISVDKVAGASVVKIQENKLIPVLQGFITTESVENWKDYEVYIREPKKEVLEQVERKEEEVLVQEPDVKVENNEIEVKEVINQESKNLEIEENEVEDSNADVSIIEDRFEDEVEDTQGTDINFEKYENEIEAIKTQELEKDFPSGAIGEYFKNIATGLEEIEVLSPEIKRCRWYKIPIKHSKDFSQAADFNKYSVIYYPMEVYYRYISRYGYFNIGYKYDKKGRMKYIVFAIPGTKYGYEQPYDGKSGFVTWVSADNSKDRESTFGYWLMFYDFRNRTIAIPIK